MKALFDALDFLLERSKNSAGPHVHKTADEHKAALDKLKAEVLVEVEHDAAKLAVDVAEAVAESASAPAVHETTIPEPAPQE